MSHTAQEIASIVKEMANTEFMLENRLDAIASDQGANFVAAVRLLIEEGVGEEQVRCSCHKLQLSIKNALEVCMDICMTIITAFIQRYTLSIGKELPCYIAD